MAVPTFIYLLTTMTFHVILKLQINKKDFNELRRTPRTHPL
jgi:hypothetical protein